jgi:hypothetical protein
MASYDVDIHCLPVEVLDARDSQWWLPGRTPGQFAHLDIGIFPEISPALRQEMHKGPPAEKLLFSILKYMHTTNNSDLALVRVKVQKDADLKILKMVTRCTVYDEALASFVMA